MGNSSGSSLSTKSTTNDSSKNGEWSGKFYFYDFDSEKFVIYDSSELKDPENFLPFIDIHQKIVKIFNLESDLFPRQITRMFLYHTFLIFETIDFW